MPHVPCRSHKKQTACTMNNDEFVRSTKALAKHVPGYHRVSCACLEVVLDQGSLEMRRGMPCSSTSSRRDARSSAMAFAPAKLYTHYPSLSPWGLMLVVAAEAQSPSSGVAPCHHLLLRLLLLQPAASTPQAHHGGMNEHPLSVQAGNTYQAAQLCWRWHQLQASGKALRSILCCIQKGFGAILASSIDSI